MSKPCRDIRRIDLAHQRYAVTWHEAGAHPKLRQDGYAPGQAVTSGLRCDNFF